MKRGSTWHSWFSCYNAHTGSRKVKRTTIPWVLLMFYEKSIKGFSSRIPFHFSHESSLVAFLDGHKLWLITVLPEKGLLARLIDGENTENLTIMGFRKVLYPVSYRWEGFKLDTVISLRWHSVRRGYLILVIAKLQPCYLWSFSRHSHIFLSWFLNETDRRCSLAQPNMPLTRDA